MSKWVFLKIQFYEGKKTQDIVNGKTELRCQVVPIWEGNIFVKVWRMNN